MSDDVRSNYHCFRLHQSCFPLVLCAYSWEKHGISVVYVYLPIMEIYTKSCVFLQGNDRNIEAHWRGGKGAENTHSESSESQSKSTQWLDIEWTKTRNRAKWRKNHSTHEEHRSISTEWVDIEWSGRCCCLETRRRVMAQCTTRRVDIEWSDSISSDHVDRSTRNRLSTQMSRDRLTIVDIDPIQSISSGLLSRYRGRFWN